MYLLEVVCSPRPKDCSSACVRSNTGAAEPLLRGSASHPGETAKRKIVGGKAFHILEDIEVLLPGDLKYLRDLLENAFS